MHCAVMTHKGECTVSVLCFGSLNIDYTYEVPHFVAAGETLASASLQQFAGGKGLNQSVALARAGAKVYHAGAIGPEGEFLLETLRSSGVDVRYVQTLAQVRTGHAIIQKEQGGDNCILLYGGANRCISTAWMAEVLSHFGVGDVLMLQNEINDLDELMVLARQRGMKIALNPSPMEPGVLSLPLELVDLFFLNEVEARQVVGAAAEAEWEELLRALQKKFPGAAIVLTLGSAGAVYQDGKETLFQPACPVEVVDTTAAGDTFSGYFLGSVLRGETVAKAMETAARASALACMRHGAAPSIPHLAEVLRI